MYNLIERPDPSKEFLLVRHGQDNDTLDTNLNQPLIPDSINQIEGIVSRVKVIFSTEITFTVVYGPSKRTSQTAQHLAGTLSKFGYNLDLQEDADIKEFYQGQFHVDHSLLTNGRYVPLETAWEIFNNKILDGQIHYRFGDPIVNTDGEPTFPLLQSFFIRYGESQSNFLVRIRRLISRVNNDQRLPNNLLVVVTHQAVASRIQREITGERIQLGYCEGVFVPYPDI